MVTVTRTAGGAVVSNPAGINCPPSCAVEFPDATTVSLTAVPFQMSTFVGWSGACEGAGTDPLCTLTLDADVAAGAAFDANAFALTVLRNGGGSGRVVSEPSGINCGSTCTAFFDRDSTVTLTATPNAGSEFGAWGGVCSGKTPTCQVTMDDARSVRARFDVPQAQLVVNKSGTGAGRVTSDVGDLDCGATCTVSVDVGTTIVLTATAAFGSTFEGWSGDASGCADTDTTCSIVMSEDRTVGVQFDGISYTLSVTRIGAGEGTVASTPSGINCGADCTEAYGQGEEVTLVATPSAGSTFVAWGGDCAGTDAASDCLLTMTEAKAATAEFDVARYAATVSVTGNGTVVSNPSGINCGSTCAAEFAGGHDVVFTATPGAGQVVAAWGGVCASAGRASTCTVVVTQAFAVSVSFAPFFEWPLTVDARCLLLLHFDQAPPSIANACGGGAAATSSGGFTSVASRTAGLLQAFSAPTTGPGHIETARRLLAPAAATIELTIRRSGSGIVGAQGVLYGDRDETEPLGAGIEIFVADNGSLTAQTFDDQGATTVVSTPAATIAVGSWYQVAASLDGTALRLLVDGTQVASTPGPVAWVASSSTAWVGSKRDGRTGAVFGFNGVIDELRVSDSARY